MTDPRRRRFGSYLRDLADRLGLRDWTVRVLDGAPDTPDAVATVDCPSGRKIAAVNLSDGFLDLSPAEQRQTLTHELVHCHFWPAYDLAHQYLSEDAFAAFRQALEYGVDGLADVLAPHLPVPPGERTATRTRRSKA